MTSSRSHISRFRSIAAKILSLVAFLGAMMILIAATGILQMQKIGGELTEIAEETIPLTVNVTNVTLHQMEQALLLERLLRAAGLAASEATGTVSSLTASLTKLAETVQKEILEAEDLAQHGIKLATTAENRRKYETVLEQLKRIEKEHNTYDDHIGEVVAQISAGDLGKASALAVEIEREQHALNAELAALTADLNSFTEASAREAKEHELHGLRLMAIVSLIAIAAGTAIALLISIFGISRPLRNVVHALNRLAQDDTSVQLKVRSRDEIGALAVAFEAFREKTIEIKRLQAQAKEEEERIEQEKRDATLRLADNLEATVKGVSDSIATAVKELEATAQMMARNANDTSSTANTVAAAAEESSRGVQTVASAAEELAASIGEISRQVTAALGAVGTTTENARSSSETVGVLAASARRIDDVVKLINDIAAQTNLLALNATIEAARAGEAGRGFAVVAGEVKALATQTGQATEDISRQVGEMQSGASLTSSAIEAVVTAISQINGQISAIASAIEEQNAVTSEIARNVHEVAQGSDEITRSIGAVRESAMDSSSGARQVLSTVGVLSEQSRNLQNELGTFLRNIRAA
ncbi:MULTISPECIES: methyl-accepting chemotaxis protein [unclassified Pannonibacter]|uniref:methyl-accepting chemotaxis protein n=1 Tax=unclassified Pannonibacter TaxID=2627228 RepID=UPI001AD93B19|nr:MULTISPECIES: methyl-accepting chemotaxis protein [unclassified Pannonibacter]